MEIWPGLQRSRTNANFVAAEEEGEDEDKAKTSIATEDSPHSDDKSFSCRGRLWAFLSPFCMSQ